MNTHLLHTTHTDITTAARLLREGGLVAFPTETVYGLGANALDEQAVRKVYEVKGRPTDNPMIVHVSSVQQARELMQVEPPLFAELTNEFWPGPLTLIVRHNAAVLDVVTAALDTVALRMPDLAVTRRLLEAAGVPVAAPSANLSGRPSPTTAQTVFEELNGRIDAVLDGGDCPVGIESTVLDLTSPQPVILRPGTVTREDIEEVIQGNVYFADAQSGAPRSPGTKYRHYAPHAPLKIIPWESDPTEMQNALQRSIAGHLEENERVGLLAPSSYRDCGEHVFFSLGDGSALSYARLLYAGLRSLDTANVDIILCPAIEAVGVGVAVMNRLEKAAD
ncbi:threonylcarbamoyl-AMP synthase [bacterium]|nr:threonylcarbamoyl-AMP synthase [bacterium]